MRARKTLIFLFFFVLSPNVEEIWLKKRNRFHSFIPSGFCMKATLRLLWGHRHQLTSTLMSWVQETQTSRTSAPFSLCGRSQGSLVRVANLCKATVTAETVAFACQVQLMMSIFNKICNVTLHASLRYYLICGIQSFDLINLWFNLLKTGIFNFFFRHECNERPPFVNIFSTFTLTRRGN